MKKLISILLTAVLMLMLAVPCFAAGTVKFSINVVSQTDSQVSISIDYEGGAAFACYDFELKYNDKKLSVISAVEGDGWDKFAKDAKINGGAVISSINPNENPIKGTCATTNPFKVVNGKDLAVISFKKLVKEKLNSSDISLKFTNCQTAEFDVLKTDVKNLIDGEAITGASSTADKTESKTDKVNSVQSSEIASSDSSEEKSTENISSVENSIYSENTTDINSSEVSAENSADNSNNTKKIITVAAAAVCMVFIIAAVCTFLIKKSKKDGE